MLKDTFIKNLLALAELPVGPPSPSVTSERGILVRPAAPASSLRHLCEQ